MDCPRLGRFLSRCAFEPRYDETAVNVTPEQMKALHDLVYTDDAVEALGSVARSARAYVGDACARCGKFVPVQR